VMVGASAAMTQVVAQSRVLIGMMGS